jgi:hypothetical protein
MLVVRRARTTDVVRQAVVDVLAVEHGVEGLPVGQREVRC